MGEALKLLCVQAHPDDESLGNGSILAECASQGIETSILCATRGERGWPADPATYPGLTELGRIREGELRDAAQVLGVHETCFLDYIDGELDQADPVHAAEEIAAHIRRIRPQVIVTFGPDGAYGHPDHIAISQFTTAALVLAAAIGDEHNPAHVVDKLYFMAIEAEEMAIYEAVFGEFLMVIDGKERRSPYLPDWMITTRVDSSACWRQVLDAVACHRTQLPVYEKLMALDEDSQLALWGSRGYYRVYSRVNGGRGLETDLFAGLRGRT